jgi:hypothetical protein
MLYIHQLASYITGTQLAGIVPLPIVVGLVIVATLLATKVTLSIGPLKLELNRSRRRRRRRRRTNTAAQHSRR